MFIHIGLEHLALNLLTLYFSGSTARTAIRQMGVFLALYLISGVGGNILSFALSSNISAGASTSLFGFLAPI